MARPGWKKRLVLAIKATLGVVVLVAVGRHVLNTWRALGAKGETPSLDLGGMALGVGLYLAGLVLFGIWYWRILEASPSRVGPLGAVRAYLISHLGKYVPGKAMVVVLRVGLAAPYGARPATAAFAAFYETTVMMAAGGLLAAAVFAFGPARSVPLTVGSLGTIVVPLALLGLGPALAFLVLAWPRVFPGLARRLTMPFPGVGPEALPRFRGRLLGEGLAWSLGGWVCWGLSQVAVIHALSPDGLPPSAWPLAMGSVALATVAGFLVPVAPGGLGVREWVLWTALDTVLDHDRAVLASLALRLAWVIGEVVGAAALAPLRPPRAAVAAPREPRTAAVAEVGALGPHGGSVGPR